MNLAKALARLSFYESLIEMIKVANPDGMELLATMIKMTRLSRGHDEIKKAWTIRCSELSIVRNDVIKDIQEQKEVLKYLSKIETDLG